jgi:hypothetical protein
MKQPARFQGITAVVLLLTLATSAGAQALTAEQRAALERGDRVLLTERRATSPWPAMTVFRLVDATPEEATGVFMDYDAHRLYVPSVIVSRVSKRIDAATAEVDYVVDVPFVRDEAYTVRDHVSRDSTGVYRLEWTLLHAMSTKASDGFTTFTRYAYTREGRHRDATLIEYHNFVIPGSRLAGLGFVRSKAVRQSEETVEALVRRIATIRADSSARARAVSASRAAVDRR